VNSERILEKELVMCRDEVIERLRTYKPILQSRYGIKRLALFGSAARDEMGPDSDIDILVEMTPSFDNFFDLERELQNILGRRVDLGTFRALRMLIRQRIEKELIDV
jgi:predicted nucleotidyltransferase